MKLNVKRLLFSIVILFPFINFLLTLFLEGVKYKIIFAFLTIFIAFVNFDYIDRKKILNLIILDGVVLVDYLYGFFTLKDPYYFMTFDFYTYILMFVFMFYWLERENVNYLKNNIKNFKRFPIINAFLTCVVLLFTLFLGTGLVSKHGTTVFIGIYGLEHELAYHLISSYFLIMLGERDFGNKRGIGYIYKAIFAIFILMSGVRTALLLLLILLWFDFKNMKISYRILICLLVLFGGALLFTNPNLLSKIPLFSKSEVSSTAGDVTNGRFVMSERGLTHYFNKTDFSEKMLGITMVNLRQNVFWDGLHAHNDFVNILLGYGALNLVVFLLLLINYAKRYRVEFILIIILASLLNGLFMYYELVLAIPIMLLFSQKKEEKILNEQIS